MPLSLEARVTSNGFRKHGVGSSKVNKYGCRQLQYTLQPKVPRSGYESGGCGRKCPPPYLRLYIMSSQGGGGGLSRILTFGTVRPYLAPSSIVAGLVSEGTFVMWRHVTVICTSMPFAVSQPCNTASKINTIQYYGHTSPVSMYPSPSHCILQVALRVPN